MISTQINSDMDALDIKHAFDDCKICDVILGNQSEVEHLTFSIFYLIEVLIG